MRFTHYGAGKTTLVEILEGLRRATSGTATVLGLDPATASAALRARIGVQLQATAFMPELTVVETLRLHGALYARTSAPATVLERVDLADKSKALVRTLSGGQRQRLALAMAMLHDPDLYILDEPTTGLGSRVEDLNCTYCLLPIADRIDGLSRAVRRAWASARATDMGKPVPQRDSRFSISDQPSVPFRSSILNPPSSIPPWMSRYLRGFRITRRLSSVMGSV